MAVNIVINEAYGVKYCHLDQKRLYLGENIAKNDSYGLKYNTAGFYGLKYCYEQDSGNHHWKQRKVQ
jgi:hypothetical protein